MTTATQHLSSPSQRGYVQPDLIFKGSFWGTDHSLFPEFLGYLNGNSAGSLQPVIDFAFPRELECNRCCETHRSVRIRTALFRI